MVVSFPCLFDIAWPFHASGTSIAYNPSTTLCKPHFEQLSFYPHPQALTLLPPLHQSILFSLTPILTSLLPSHVRAARPRVTLRVPSFSIHFNLNPNLIADPAMATQGEGSPSTVAPANPAVRSKPIPVVTPLRSDGVSSASVSGTKWTTVEKAK